MNGSLCDVYYLVTMENYFKEKWWMDHLSIISMEEGHCMSICT